MLKELERKLKILIRKNLDKKEANEILERLRVFLNFEKEYGDYSTNLIFLLEKFSPQKKDFIINEIKNKFKDFEKIEIINNYLNFYLSKKFLSKNLKNALKKLEKFLKQNYGRNQKVNIDYVSANPTGPLTMGNARGAVLGDVLANILKILGFRVTKEYYVNDRGLQIELLGKTILAHLGKIPFEENFYQGDYLKEIAQKLNFENLDSKIVGKKTADYILKNFIKPSLRKFGTLHDWFFFETELYKNKWDKKVLEILKRKKLIEEKDGAVFLKLTKLGEDKDEVLIKKTGEPTYFFSDLIHYYYKFFIKRNKIEILIVASDHLDHCRRLKSALKIFNIKNYYFQPIVYQMVHLKKGEEILKMSKRKGTYVTLDDLMEKLDPGIIRFFFLQKSPDSTIEFDLDLTQKESEENPYFYVQYAYARLNSILEKAKYKKMKIDPLKTILGVIDIESAYEILRFIYKFKDLLLIIYQEKKPNLLIDYLINFSKLIHNFYEKERILPNSPSEKINIHKLNFVYFLKNYLGFVLKLAEIKPMEKI